MNPLNLPPLSLYVHVPWCIKKCPYCDFNSHTKLGELPLADYLGAIKLDLRMEAANAGGRKIQSIFFGGGTPSLLPATIVDQIIDAADTYIGLQAGAEITLEANPGTGEYTDFKGLLSAGVNRISMGAQSFQNDALKALGRIHGKDDIYAAYQKIQSAGFQKINLDLMHGLPGQSLSEALDDVRQAIDLQAGHISWYQLTIEPNTSFYSLPPQLPDSDTLENIHDAGLALLADQGYAQYEVSAFAKPGQPCQHNLNYWRFGDYLAVGPGAHGKTSQFAEASNKLLVTRYAKTRMPDTYINLFREAPSLDSGDNPFLASSKRVPDVELPLEFAMNALRLKSGVDSALFERHTGLPLSAISAALSSLRKSDLLAPDSSRISCTEIGYRHLDTVLREF